MILPQKKPMQPPQVSAQDGVRSDLLKAIRDGKKFFFLSFFFCKKISILQMSGSLLKVVRFMYQFILNFFGKAERKVLFQEKIVFVFQFHEKKSFFRYCFEESGTT